MFMEVSNLEWIRGRIEIELFILYLFISPKGLPKNTGSEGIMTIVEKYTSKTRFASITTKVRFEIEISA